MAFGQSGSNLFQTDNASFWTAYGVLSTSPDFVHQGLSMQQFAAVRRVLEGLPLAIASARRQDLLVYPNPVRDVLHVALPASQGTTTVTLHDAVGRLIRTETHPQPSRGLQLNLAGALPGIYALRVVLGQQVFQCKIVEDVP